MSEQEHNATHILPLSLYIGVWLALMVLTFITVAVSYFDFGSMNMIVAMVVATLKASIVALFFMHLAFDEKFNGLALVTSTIFIALFFIFVFADLKFRGEYDPVEGNFVKQMAPAQTKWQENQKIINAKPKEEAPVAK